MRLDIKRTLVICGMALVGAAATPLTQNVKLTSIEAASSFGRQVDGLVASPAGPHWIGWSVPVVPDAGTSCCFENLGVVNATKGRCGGCKLENEHSSITIGSNDTVSVGGKAIQLEAPKAQSILLRAAGGKIGRIRTFSENCALDAGGLSFTWIDNVAPADSLALLEKLALDAKLRDDDGDKMSDAAAMAIAMHADPKADQILTRFAAEGHDSDLREQAIFWLGNQRGRAGYEVLRRIVKDDPDEEIRDKAVFALSQSRVPEAIDIIINVAHQDPSSEVRGQALFWLAQEAGERALASITDAVERDPETEVKKKAVFALSQIPDEQGVPMLMKLARTHSNPEIRKEAMFWLGQSEDPRALQFIEDILTK